MTTFDGGCHCGAVAVRFETAQQADAVQIRACGCTFCRKHASRNASDPDGALTIFADDGALEVYRFGAEVTDFLLCKTCGVYVAATMAEDGAACGTVNLNVLDDPTLAARGAELVSYDAESGGDKIARRRRVWTPTAFRTRNEAP
jgi:hypothetical protein